MLARLRRSPRLYLFIEGGSLLVFASTCLMTYLVVSGQKQPDKLLTPPVVALLLVANLVPAIALLVLLGRRIAKRRAAQSVIGGDGQLHVRLVAIFSIDRKSTRLNSSHYCASRMPSSALTKKHT